MSVNSKKLSMADKMYKQNSSGGLGSLAEKYKQSSKGKGKVNIPKQTGNATGRAGGQNFHQSNGKGKFADKYEQADASGSMKGGYKMANC